MCKVLQNTIGHSFPKDFSTTMQGDQTIPTDYHTKVRRETQKNYLASQINLHPTNSEIFKKPSFNSASCEYSLHLFIHELIH